MRKPSESNNKLIYWVTFPGSMITNTKVRRVLITIGLLSNLRRLLNEFDSTN